MTRSAETIDFVIYGAPISPFVQRVLMQLRAKGIAPPLREPPGGLHSDAYRALSPIDKVPVMAVAGRHIPESAVIADWIEDTHPVPALRPADPLERAEMALIARIADIYVMNRMLPLFANLDPRTRDAAVVSRTLADVEQGLDWLAHYISPEGFAAGGALTLADCSCTPILWFARQFMPVFGAPEPIAARPKLAAWWERIGVHPAGAATMADLAAALAAVRQSAA
jgi:glutathione S-transferase